jgi:hypothetical protein
MIVVAPTFVIAVAESTANVLADPRLIGVAAEIRWML